MLKSQLCADTLSTKRIMQSENVIDIMRLPEMTDVDLAYL